jgi:hypothetical protein
MPSPGLSTAVHSGFSTELSTALSTLGKRSDDLWITFRVLTPVRPEGLVPFPSEPLIMLGKRTRERVRTAPGSGVHHVTHGLWITGWRQPHRWGSRRRRLGIQGAAGRCATGPAGARPTPRRAAVPGTRGRACRPAPGTAPHPEVAARGDAAPGKRRVPSLVNRHGTRHQGHRATEPETGVSRCARGRPRP